MTELQEKILALLNRRVERLNDMMKENAPGIIIWNELQLIKKACDEIEKSDSKFCK